MSQMGQLATAVAKSGLTGVMGTPAAASFAAASLGGQDYGSVRTANPQVRAETSQSSDSGPESWPRYRLRSRITCSAEVTAESAAPRPSSATDRYHERSEHSCLPIGGPPLTPPRRSVHRSSVNRQVGVGPRPDLECCHVNPPALPKCVSSRRSSITASIESRLVSPHALRDPLDPP